MGDWPEPRYLYSYDDARRRKKRRKILIRRAVGILVFCGLIVTAVFVIRAVALGDSQAVATGPTESTTTTIPPLEMTVSPVSATSPTALGFSSDVFRGDTRLTSFSRTTPIEFGRGQEYTELEGVITFRGNNYREGGSYGTANIATGEMEVMWSVPTSKVLRSSGKSHWIGSGWTGQPLLVKWPDETKQVMNLYIDKKADPTLVEVIYPCLDGKIYFLDLRDGTATRPAIDTGGGAIKGTASIHPGGVPMLFVGQGDALPASEPDGAVKYRIYSLVDQTLLYTFGTDDPVAPRTLWQAYDASALFDVETDTLIEPGENGLLYTVKLNTRYDPETGVLSVNPEQPIKMRYTGPEYSDGPPPENSPTTRWYGMEASPVIWDHYVYLPDNAGRLMCVDLNTMKLVWTQDIVDDSNSTPLFEEWRDDGTAYIYGGPSLHISESPSGTSGITTGKISIWKIDAATGEKVWESQPYTCYSRRSYSVSGGVQGTGVLGRHDIGNLVIYPVAGMPSVVGGALVALDKYTGTEIWRFPMGNYAWSSPVAVYTADGKSYIIICDTAGTITMLEGTTGDLMSSVTIRETDSFIEATPAVYGNMLVVGTKGTYQESGKIIGIQLR